MSLKRILQGSFLLLLANLSAGGLNYLFQVRAAARLSNVSYGHLNTWMAYLSLALSLGGIAQIASNFFELDRARFRRAGAALLLAVAGSGAALAWRWQAGLPSPWVAGGTALALGVAYQYFVGQFQIRTRFGWMGAAMAIAAAAKFAGTFASPGAGHEGSEFYLAFALSYAAAGAWLALGAIALPGGPPVPAAPRARLLRQELACAAALALALALIPQIDLLNLRALHDDETIGLFSRASLFSKAIFFAALTLLQVTLPYHVARERGGGDPVTFRRIQLFEAAGLGFCVVSAFILAALSPWASRRFLGFDLSGEQSWVLLSCLSLTALYGQLQKIQLRVAQGLWKGALARVALIALIVPAAQLIRPEGVVTYLGWALGYYLFLSLADIALERRRG